MKKILLLFALAAFNLSSFTSQAQCTNGTDCYVVVNCIDNYPYSYSSTWSYSSVQVLQNGVVLATCNDPYSDDTIRICTENGPLSFSYAYAYSWGDYYKQYAALQVTDSAGNLMIDINSFSDYNDGVFWVEQACPTCNKPSNLTLDTVTSSSAIISWVNTGGTASSYYYCLNTSNEPTGTWQFTNNATATLSDLEDNTKYHFFVYSNCGAGDTSAVSHLVFRTECGETILPYTESFESYNPEDYMPYCWTRTENSSGYPQVYTYEGYTGSNSLYFYPVNGNQAIASPRIPVPANTVEMLCWVSGAEQVEVGYVTSTADGSPFHLVGFVGPSTVGSDGYSYNWEQFTVSFDTVTTTDSIYVVFRCGASIEYNTVNIDDVVIRQINNCPLPTDVTASSNASQTATVSWTCPTGSQWQIFYGLQGFNPDTATTFVTSNTTSATVTGLDNGTIYEFYVRTVCGSQHSYWSLPATIVPYLYTVTASVDTIVACDRPITDNGGLTGNALEGTNQTIVLMPSAEGQTVRIQGYAHIYSDYSSDYPNYMRIFAGSDTTGRLLASYNSTDVNNIDLTSDVGPMTIWFSTTSYSYYVPEGFFFHVGCETLPACATPYNFTVSNVTGVSALVSWNYDNTVSEAEGFTLILENADGSTVYNVDGSDRSLALTSLSERTFYTLSLVVNCEDADTLTTSFATVCNNGGELQIGDENGSSDKLPSNLYYGNSLTQQIFTAAELGNDTVLYGVMFNLVTEATDTRRIDIYMDTTSLTSFSSTADYVPQSHLYYSGTYTFTQGWNSFDFDSAFVVTEGKNILLTVSDHTGSYTSQRYFEASSTTDNMAIYSYRDNSSYDPTESDPFSGTYGTGMSNQRNNVVFLTPCSESSCIPPAIAGTVVGSTTVTVNWLPGGSETAWRVEYRANSSTVWDTAVASTTDNTYTLTGLNPATNYRIRIVALCGDDDESAATVNVTTQCGSMPIPFSENFEDFTASSDSYTATQMCWNRGSEYPYSAYPYTYSWVGFNSAQCMFMGGYRSYIVLPEMSVSLDSLNITFFATCDGSDYYGDQIVEVGVCTDASDTSTFVVLGSKLIDCTSYDWEEVDVDLENWTGANGRIFIRSASSNYAYLYIDSLIVNRLPTCRRVNGLSVSSIMPNSAVLTIADSHNYGSYTVMIGTSDDTTAATSFTTNLNTLTLDSLDENTLYYVWVSSNCSDTEHSKLTKITFRTSCNPFVVEEDNPYLEEFEDGILSCMSQPADNTAKWNIIVNDYTYTAYSGGHMAALTTSSYSAYGMLVLPTFDFSLLTDDAQLSFYRYMYYSSYDPAPSLSVYYRTSVSADWTLLAVVEDSPANLWQKKLFTLPASQGAPFYQVALKAENVSSYTNVLIDNVIVKKPSTCLDPENLVVRNVTDRTATVAWTGTAPAYKVQYRPEGNLSWNARTVEGVDSVVIMPLNMATPYEVRVTGVCSPFDQSEPTDVVTFSTEFCGQRTEISNYSAGATATVTYQAPFNPVKYYSYAEVLVDSAHLAGLSNIDGLAFHVNTVGGGSALTHCEVHMAHTNATSLSAFLYDTSFTQVFSGDASFTTTGVRPLLFSNPFVWDGHSNIVVGFYYGTPNYNTYDTVRYDAHEASANMVYQGSSTSSFSLDQANLLSAANRGASNIVPDLTFYGCNAVCYEPVVSNISTTATDINVRWYNEYADVEICIRNTGDPYWDYPELVSGDYRYTFSGLQPITSYDIRLRRVCADNEYSDWVEYTVLTDTACSIPDSLSVSAVSANSATFSWHAGAIDGGKWELHVWSNNFNQYYDVTTNPATITGLLPNGNYNAEVRAYCGSNDHVVGEYSDAITFGNICQPVDQLTATLQEGDNVYLHWYAGEHNQQWLVSWGYAGFAPNEMLGYMIVSTNSATITGLAGAKGIDANRYAFRVRAICGEEWNSDWSDDVIATINTSIDDVDAASVTLSPNPATTTVTLNMGNFEGEALVSILSVDGREMQRVNVSTYQPSIDVSTLAKGTYFVRIQTASWTTVSKLVVE